MSPSVDVSGQMAGVEDRIVAATMNGFAPLNLTVPNSLASVRDLDESELIVRVDEWSRQPFHVHVVREAMVVGGAFPICMLARGGHNIVLSETSDYAPWAAQWGETALADEANARIVGEVDEACCLALPHNYCHWHQEALPKICIMERMGYRGSYIIADVPLFLESLDLVGIGRERIHPLAQGSLRVARLYVPQPLPLAHGSLFPMALWDARMKCLEGAETGRSAPRLFISRSPDTHRHIVEEEAFRADLEHYGFEMVRMENFSLRQQIGLASSAKVIVGPHGAGMANSLFMYQHGKIFELFSPMYINCCILPICRLLNLSYWHLVSQVNPVGGYRHGENILPDRELMRFYLDRYLV